MFHDYFEKTDSVDYSIFLPGKDKWHHHGRTDYYILTSFFALLGNGNFHIEAFFERVLYFQMLQ